MKNKKNKSLTQSPCCFNFFLQQFVEQLERLYAFQEHMKEETEMVFKLKLYLRKEFKGETGGTCHGTEMFFFYSNVTKSVT